QPTPPLFPYTTLFRSGRAPAYGSLQAINFVKPDLFQDEAPTLARDDHFSAFHKAIAGTHLCGDNHLALRADTAAISFRHQPVSRSEEHTSELQSRENL